MAESLLSLEFLMYIYIRHKVIELLLETRIFLIFFRGKARKFNGSKPFGISRELGSDRFGLLNIQTGHQPVKLLPGKVPGFRTVPGPTVSSLHGQPFVDQNKTIAFPK